jgi:hypothetical protein
MSFRKTEASSSTPPSAPYCATANKAGTVSSDVSTHILVSTIHEKSEQGTQVPQPVCSRWFLSIRHTIVSKMEHFLQSSRGSLPDTR